MQSFYRAYGLSIASSRRIPYLSQTEPIEEAEVEIEFHDVDPANPTGQEWAFGHPVSKPPFVGFDVFHKPDRHKVRCFLPAGGFFEFVASTHRVDVLLPNEGPAVPPNDVVSFLIGPVLGIVCRLRQQPCLHASVLEVEGRAFALIGDQGAGKSTTAAVLNAKGANLVTDDIAVLATEEDGHVLVQPGYPHMRLGADIAAMCEHRTPADHEVLLGGGKYYVAAYSEDTISHFPSGPVPLDRVYLLTDREEKAVDFEIHVLDHAIALRELNRNAYGRQVTNAEMRQKDFRVFADLARSGTVRTTVRPDGLATLDGFCDQLLLDFTP